MSCHNEPKLHFCLCCDISETTVCHYLYIYIYIYIYICTVSRRSEYTTHIFVNILLLLFM